MTHHRACLRSGLWRPLAAVGLAALAFGADAAAQDFVYAPEKDAVGRLYHYQRSNQDGSEQEQVHVFRASPENIVVYKMRTRCTNAAYVTARLDLDTMSPVAMTGGRLLPDAGHEDFGFLAFDADSAALTAEIPGAGLEGAVEIGHVPWHLYDFDLASLTVATPHLADPEGSFTVGLPMIWNDFEREDFLSYLGEVEATYDGEETLGNTAARRYRLSGSALGGEPGTLWLDAADGHADAEPQGI